MRIEINGRGTVELSPYLLGNLRAVHGDRVDPWIDGLPETLRNTLADLDAHVVAGDPPLSYHLVFFARQADGTDIVVKCTVPNHEQPPELAAVNALSDASIGPRLVWWDLDRGAFGPLSTSQWIALGTTALAAFLFVRRPAPPRAA